MKVLENRETEFTQEEVKLGFANLAIICLQNPPKDGWDPKSIKTSMVIESKLEKAKMGGDVDLENAEFDYLYTRSQPENMRWALRHMSIVDYSEHLEEVKKQKD